MSERKMAVVTGASSGLGRATATTLASAGWDVIGHGRSAARCEAALVGIRAAAAPGVTVHMFQADLASLADTSQLLGAIRTLTPRIDVLINNAGGMCREKVVTAEGNEATFAGNHLGHFLLMTGLIDALARSASPRVISVSSSAHERCGGFDWTDPQMLTRWSSGESYCQVKLANLLFTRELAKRFGAERLVASAVDPGVIDTNFLKHTEPATQAYMRTLNLRPAEEACDTIVWLATAPDAPEPNGRYWRQRTLAEPTRAAQDMDEAARLWDYSAALCRPFL